jgi:biotin-dependent carboxylase-like uncharacterized protein
MLEIVATTGLATIQDLGRPGRAHLGVPPSGALDPSALRLANRLVGNPPEAAGIEIMGGLRLRVSTPVTVALTGAPGTATDGPRPIPLYAPVQVRTLSIGYAETGGRRYLAVAGGIAVEPVLGSRSTDTLSGLGPAPLTAGVVLPLGVPGKPSTVDFAPQSAPQRELRLGITFGPRDDLFRDAGELLRWAYTMSLMSDRIGARLDGPALTRADLGELPSEPIVTGAVQVPADGRPLIFLNDHPTTGGYPVIAVVDAADVPKLALAGPGTPVRFVRTRPR